MTGVRPSRAAPDRPRIAARSRNELRGWLAANHATETTHWLITFRRHHPDWLPWPQVVEELIFWGWIDSLPRALDADRTMLLIAPRDPESAWSAANKAHVDRARESGAMTAAGEAAVAAARANGMWTFLDDVARLEVPADLASALAAADARATWDTFPTSVRRATLEWVKSARQPATRERRIAAVATAAAAGERPPIFRRAGLAIRTGRQDR